MPESDNITLVTADEPPVRHSIPRSQLCALSKTFDDLLSLPTRPTGDDSEEMAHTETDAQLEGFLKVIRGEEIANDDFSKSGPVDWSASASHDKKVYWINLAKVTDRYDCPTARLYVTSTIWCVFGWYLETTNALS